MSKLRRFLEEVKQREQHIWQYTEIPDGITATRNTLRTLRRMVEKVLWDKESYGFSGCSDCHDEGPCGTCTTCRLRQDMEAEIE